MKTCKAIWFIYSLKTVLNQIGNDNCDKGFFIENLCVISFNVKKHISAALNIEQNCLSVGVKAKIANTPMGKNAFQE